MPVAVPLSSAATTAEGGISADAAIRAAMLGKDGAAGRRARAERLRHALPPMTPSEPSDQLWRVLEEKLADRARARQGRVAKGRGLIARLLAASFGAVFRRTRDYP